MLDIFMLTNGEPNAEANFELLKETAPHAKRIDNVKGILNAHKAAAEESRTQYFYVVDADAQVMPNFSFKFSPDERREVYPGVKETDCIYTYRSHNPINDLIYGYGAIKLFPKKQLLKVPDFTVDMTTSLGMPFKPLFEISNTTAFNSDPFNTWKSAFRECTKLSSAIIGNTPDIDNKYRMEVWTTRGEKRQYGNYCLLGANQGADFGNFYRGNVKALSMVNDWEWLRDTFEEACEEAGLPLE